jgi:Excalibur calcium-binding domain
MNLQLNRASAVLAVGAIILALSAPFANAASDRIPARWKNCTVVNKRYPHGVGKVGARDRTSGEPVLTFKRSNLLYRTAMRYNRGLDRDRDGIACEKL